MRLWNLFQISGHLMIETSPIKLTTTEVNLAFQSRDLFCHSHTLMQHISYTTIILTIKQQIIGCFRHFIRQCTENGICMLM